jgi:hypothetical protein
MLVLARTTSVAQCQMSFARMFKIEVFWFLLTAVRSPAHVALSVSRMETQLLFLTVEPNRIEDT